MTLEETVVPPLGINDDGTRPTKSTRRGFFSLLSWIFTSQPVIHLLLVFNQSLYGAFGVIGPISLAFIHPFVFAVGRIFLIGTTSTLLATMLESHYWFKGSSKSSNTAAASIVVVDGGFVDQEETHDGSGDNNIQPPSLPLPSSSSSLDNDNNDQQQLMTDDRECPWPFSLIRIPDWQDGLLLFLAGSLMAYGVFSYVLAVKLAPYTIVAILQPTMSAFACFFSVLLRREGVSIAKVLGVLLAVLGSIGTLLTITLVDRKSEHKGTDEHTSFEKIAGALLELSNSVIIALFLVTQKTLLSRGMPPVTFVAWTFSISLGISMMVGAYFFHIIEFAAIPLKAWLGLLYAGLVIGTLAFVISSFASKHTTPTIVAIYNTTAPVYSAIFLYVFRGETTTPWAIPGALAIGAGVILVAFAKHREGKREQEALALKQASILEREGEESSFLLGGNAVQSYGEQTGGGFSVTDQSA